MARVLEAKPTSDARLKLAQMMLEDPEVADAYQELFGDLRLAPPLAAGNSILVTSAAPDEGKTTVSLCLAITASCAGQTALLIDGDLRRSSLTAAIGGDGSAGLIEVLLGQAEAGEAIRHAAIEGPKTDRVSFMPRRAQTSPVSGSRGLVQGPPCVQIDLAGVRLRILGLAAGLGGQRCAALRWHGGRHPSGRPRRKRQSRRNQASQGTSGVRLARRSSALCSIGSSRRLHGRSNRPYSGYYRR